MYYYNMQKNEVKTHPKFSIPPQTSPPSKLQASLSSVCALCFENGAAAGWDPGQ
jgi:hypothetical protein